MAFRLGDTATGARALRPCWPKETRPSQGKAEAHLRALARHGTTDETALNAYACRWYNGWHVGHRPDLHKGDDAMSRAKTFDEVLEANRRERLQKAASPDLSRLDFEKVANDILREAAREAGLLKAGVPIEKSKSAVDEVEARIAARIQARPELTRAVVVGEIFQSNPGLYDRVRAETTVAGHGRTLREIYDKVTVVGKSGDGESVADEVARRVETLVAKTAGSTTQQAMAFLFKNDPGLYARWRAAAYA